MLFKLVKNLFQNHPRLSNSVTYGLLYVGGEFSQQMIIRKVLIKEKEEKPINYAALGRYFIVGSLINSNYLYVWYKWLDKKFVGTSRSTIIKKVLLDQFVMTPPLYVIFYVSMSFMEGRANLLEECKEKFLKTFSVSCLFWLPIQTINFLYLPNSARVVYLGVCSFAWDFRRITSINFLAVTMIKLIKELDVKDFVAVVPSVSVGNVGQLASDLLISSLDLKKYGYIWHPSILAFAGPDPFGDSNEISTACEIFCSEKLKLLVFQIRTAYSGRRSDFLEELCEWLRMKQVKQVIILSGVNAHERKDKQLVGTPLRYVFCPLTKETESKKAKDRNWIELESEELQNISLRGGTITYIPGAGIAVRLFNILVKSKVPCSILLEFCYEGNNEPDALNLIDYLSEWINIKKELKGDGWVIPPSWVFFFGPQPPSQIFN